METEARYEDGTYLSENPTWHSEHSSWKARHVQDLLRRSGVAPRSLCDFGCGVGEVLRELRGLLGDEVALTGVDLSPQAISIAKERTPEESKITFQVGRVDTAELPAQDVAMALDVFEHVEDYMGFLKAMKPIAEYKVLHIPLDLSAQSVLRGRPILDRRAKIGHIHYFIKETALATLEDCGLEVVDHFFTKTALELRFPVETLGLKLLNVPRRLLFPLAPDLVARALGGFSLMVLAR